MAKQLILLGDADADAPILEKRSQKSWQHARAAGGGKDEWLTPPEIIKALGSFDLDPCASVIRPWNTAKLHFTIEDDGLRQRWAGRVFLNPPYRKDVLPLWMSKMARHGNGVALIFARTDTNVFNRYIWDHADSMLCIKGRLHFYDIHGVRAKHDAGSPSVLIAYGSDNTEALRCSGIKGKLLPLNLRLYPVTIDFQAGRVTMHIGIPDFSRSTWQDVVSYALQDLGGKAALSEIYDKVETAASVKFQTNPTWRDTIRRVLQQHFQSVERGVWALPAAA